ncbi:hypothetical protein K474DRAFT_1713018 [Panus rudis PR-1116 ss-1]|nr:hypothetical protein K474DRAFT_1713018 [Panus rudis PR-1116 ss-1]
MYAGRLDFNELFYEDPDFDEATQAEILAYWKAKKNESIAKAQLESVKSKDKSKESVKFNVATTSLDNNFNNPDDTGGFGGFGNGSAPPNPPNGPPGGGPPDDSSIEDESDELDDEDEDERNPDRQA